MIGFPITPAIVSLKAYHRPSAHVPPRKNAEGTSCISPKTRTPSEFIMIREYQWTVSTDDFTGQRTLVREHNAILLVNGQGGLRTQPSPGGSRH
jgi:hypothetical protein